MARALNEADSSKKKLMVENQDLSRQIDEVENAIVALGKTKISLTTQLADTKRMGDTEARDRAGLLAKFKNLRRNKMHSKLCLKLRLKLPFGNQSLKLKEWV